VRVYAQFLIKSLCCSEQIARLCCAFVNGWQLTRRLKRRRAVGNAGCETALLWLKSRKVHRQEHLQGGPAKGTRRPWRARWPQTRRGARPQTRTAAAHGPARARRTPGPRPRTPVAGGDRPSHPTSACRTTGAAHASGQMGHITAYHMADAQPRGRRRCVSHDPVPQAH